MRLLLGFALIFGTWALAALIMWRWDFGERFWPLPTLLALGCSGSIIAVVSVS